MQVEELRELPVGTRVTGELQNTRKVPGVVESLKNGPSFIRWADGYVTFPFGWVQDYDEYVAARTELHPARCSRIHFEVDPDPKRLEPHMSLEPEQAISA
ncbi:MAG: hypothetical protein WCA10_09220 [Terracidiphilus sp.]